MNVFVVMPVYNAEKTLKRSIESVMNQKYLNSNSIYKVNVSLYIVNDGSTDKTNNILSEINQDNIKIINTIPLGPAGARNKALEEIKKVAKPEDFIAYCDSDDIWGETHLINALIVFASYPEVDITYSNVKLVDEDGCEMHRVNIDPPQDFNYEILQRSNYIYISSVVHRIKCLFVGDFDTELNSLEDYDYWLRLAKNDYCFRFIPKPDVTYLIKKNGMADKGKDVINRLRMKQFNCKNNLIRLNLGCGHDLRKDYINVDNFVPGSDLKADVADLKIFEDNSVDEILSNHVIEHHHFFKCFDVLKEWYRILKPGGLLNLETPDLLNTCKHFIEADEQFRIKLYGSFFAFPWEPGNAHYFLFTETQLKWTLQQIGFKDIQRVAPDSTYARSMEAKYQDLYLKIHCCK